jgi:hypothetical protein
MMTIRCRTKLATLLFCLPLGLAVAGTAYGASDDDDDDWHDTKGPRSEHKSSSDDSDEKPAAKKSSDDSDSDKAKDEEKSKDDDSDKSKDEEKSKDDEKAGKKRHGKRHHKSGPSDTDVSFAALATYGFPSPQQMGLGLRGGVHIKSFLPLYVGGLAEFFFGSATSNKDLGVRSTSAERFAYGGGEFGADVEAATDFTIRPYFGLGLGFDWKQVCPGGVCTNTTKLHPTLTPGIIGLYSLGVVFLGADLRYIIVPGSGTAGGAAISATAGVKF